MWCHVRPVSTFHAPQRKPGSGPPLGDHVKRVGIVFAGGPAPAANAVISAAATSFLEDGREVVGFFHGYSNLQDYHPVSHRLLPDKHYRVFDEKDLRGLRNSRSRFARRIAQIAQRRQSLRLRRGRS